MKILKNAGTFKVLTKSENIIESIANVARTCYQSHEFSNEESNIKLIKALIRRGHHAMLEFEDMTVCFDNVSRGFTHEMVRHRLCSFAQESTRYVDESDFRVVVPPHKDENERVWIVNNYDRTIGITLREWFKLNENMYRTLRGEGWKPEDARQVLPIATKSQIVVKANIREWRHIFHMRCDKFAHWEIKGVMLMLLNECKRIIPLLFNDFIWYDNFSEGGSSYVEDLSLDSIIKSNIYARNY